MTRLGEHIIGLRTRQVVGRNDRGSDILADVDTEVHGCLVTPTRSNDDEDNRAAPVAGARLIAPPGTPVAAAAAIVWPITGRSEVDGQLKLTGRTWEVDGDVGEWDECIDAQLTRVAR